MSGLGRVEPEKICPWCIHDGSAAAKLGVSFLDRLAVLGLRAEIQEVVTTRTPCYTGWQEPSWRTHCDDACEFVGRVGTTELSEFPPEATEAVRRSAREWVESDEECEELLRSWYRDADLSAYLFRCLHCGAFDAHVDAS
ncbi:MAG: CbrC family protein [Acidimicrobiales bacterium]|nr:CbrC family protein [Acidimicrobiales bacterium]